MDDATGDPVVGQPLVLMEEFTGGARQVKEATTDKDGEAKFALWPTLEYQIAPRIGGPVEDAFISHKITELDHESGSIVWRVKVSRPGA